MSAWDDLLEEQRQEALDDLLSRWHWWRSHLAPVSGYETEGTATSQYQTSRQYDDVNGALDDQLEATCMQQVDFEISEMGDPWRSAISALARSLCTGMMVFHSPRIQPADRARVTAEARIVLIERLIAAGVM
jgi:hypothetical protein